MRKLLLLFLAFAGIAFSQTASNCQFTVVFTTQAAQSPSFNNRSTAASGTPCTSWVVSYYTNSATGVSIQLEGAADSGGAPTGSYTALTAESGSANPATGTTSGSIILCCDSYPWIRLNPTTLTGTGVHLTARVYGWISTQAAKGIGPSPGGPAGGDLSGTYPNPNVSHLTHVTDSSLGNSGLAHPSTTVNGQTCTLGSTCTVTGGPTGSAGGALAGSYPNPTIAGVGAAGLVPISDGAGDLTAGPISCVGGVNCTTSGTFTSGVTSVLSPNGLSSGVTTAQSSTPPAYVAIPGNMVLNPSFETGGPNWTSWNRIDGTGTAFADDTVNVHSGAHAAMITSGVQNTSTERIYTNNIAVSGSTTYYLSFWSKGNNFAGPLLYVRDVTNASYIINGVYTGFPDFVWQQTVTSFTTASNTANVYVMFASPTFSNLGSTVNASPLPISVWMDDVVLLTTPITPDPNATATWTPSITEYAASADGQYGPKHPISTIAGSFDLGGQAVPAAPGVAISGTTGVLNGSYSYQVAWLTTNGISGYSATSSTVSPSSKQVNLTLPVSTDPTVIGRVIARTVANAAGGDWFYLTTIYNNTATTYADNAADGTLGTDNHFDSSGIASTSAITAQAGALTLLKFRGVSLSLGQGQPNLQQWDNILTVGDFCGNRLTFGGYTTCVGEQGLVFATQQTENSAVGAKALYSTGNGDGSFVAVGNVGLGARAGQSNTLGFHNTFIGTLSNAETDASNFPSNANVNTTGHDNTFIGYQAGPGSGTQQTFMTVIGSGATGTCNSCIVIGRSTDVTILRPPTSCTGLATGTLWNNAGTLAICP